MIAELGSVCAGSGGAGPGGPQRAGDVSVRVPSAIGPGLPQDTEKQAKQMGMTYQDNLECDLLEILRQSL